jgi:hypothetical protein
MSTLPNSASSIGNVHPSRLPSLGYTLSALCTGSIVEERSATSSEDESSEEEYTPYFASIKPTKGGSAEQIRDESLLASKAAPINFAKPPAIEPPQHSASPRFSAASLFRSTSNKGSKSSSHLVFMFKAAAEASRISSVTPPWDRGACFQSLQRAGRCTLRRYSRVPDHCLPAFFLQVQP